MRTIALHNGRQLKAPETEQEWLDMQPEAKLRELFDGDIPATLAFHDRLRDLDRRFDAWCSSNIENEIKAIWWRASIRCGVELRP